MTFLGEVILLDDEPRGEGPDDGGQADLVGQPGQEHEQSEGKDDSDVAAGQGGKELHQAGHQDGPQ